MSRRFPSPWTVVEVSAAFVVQDATGKRLAYVYWDDSAMQSASSNEKLTKDEARRIAAGITKLPELLQPK